jgi:hypothetical protein
MQIFVIIDKEFLINRNNKGSPYYSFKSFLIFNNSNSFLYLRIHKIGLVKLYNFYSNQFSQLISNQFFTIKLKKALVQVAIRSILPNESQQKKGPTNDTKYLS